MFEAFLAEVAALQPQLPTLGRGELTTVLSQLGRIRGAVSALEASATAALDALDDDGPSAAASARASTRCSQREADRRTRRAQGLATMPHTREALAEGRITEEHADVLIRAADDTSAEAVEESSLLHNAAARPADLAARDARAWVRRHQHESDRARRFRRQRADRRLSIFSGDNGMTIVHGEFDPVVGEAIRVAVEAEARRLFRLDGGRGEADKIRSRQQRLADALESLLTTEPGAAEIHPPSPCLPRPVRSQLLVVAESGVIDGTDPDGRCEIPGVGPIPTAELERLACNADIFGLVFSGDGQPLWHGRRHRTATNDQFRALVARDGGCIGCGLAPQFCEAHHIIPWAPPTRGPTDIDKLVLICRHEHHLIHDHGWKVVRGPDARFRLEPPGSTR